jgi:hypothetical protein
MKWDSRPGQRAPDNAGTHPHPLFAGTQCPRHPAGVTKSTGRPLVYGPEVQYTTSGDTGAQPNMDAAVASFTALAQLPPTATADLALYTTAVLELVPILRSMGLSMRIAASELEKNAARVKRSGFITLAALVEHERAQGLHLSDTSASTALLWTHRAMLFVEKMLAGVVASGKELKVAAKEAYAETLAPHHTWGVRQLFTIGLAALPTTQAFVEGLDKQRTFMENVRHLSSLTTGIRETNVRAAAAIGRR